MKTKKSAKQNIIKIKSEERSGLPIEGGIENNACLIKFRFHISAAGCIFQEAIGHGFPNVVVLWL